jgi:8-oxo-dGTP pyrophosphatase MutT (NUDIX family)
MLTPETVMSRDSDSILRALQVELLNRLPGQAAHEQMAPEDRARAPDTNTPPELAAVLALIYPGVNGSWEILLIQRATNAGVHSQQMAFPGGRFEEADKTLKQTAYRETAEEVSLRPSAVQEAGWLTSLYIPPSHFRVYPLLGLMPYAPTLKPDEQEVAAIVPVSVSHLQDPATCRSGLITLADGRVVRSPYFTVANCCVWGATAMILNELLRLLNTANLKL